MRLRTPALICLLLAITGVTAVACSQAAAQSDSVVASQQKAFYEAWLRRDLRPDELRAVTDEFIAMYTREKRDRAAMDEVAKSFAPVSKLLRGQDGTPAAFTTRHVVLTANYFRPDMQNTLELRLLTEPDPVRVVDPGSKRLMTQHDVIALVNIHYFAKTTGDPRHRDLQRQDIDRVVDALDRAYGNHADAVELPQFFSETAAFWAGVRQHWPTLTSEEKRGARAYAAKTYKAPMPTEMYAKLWGLDQTAALSRRQDDVLAAVVHINEVNMQATVLHTILDQVASW